MIKKETLLALYYKMVRIRMVEEKIAELYPEQEMRCPVHLSIGQEAVAVGVCEHLRQEDYVMSNHRSHGHYLAKGGNLKAMLAEIYGKRTGCSRGRGGSMHLIDLEVNIMGTTPIVAGSIPVAIGVGFGVRLKNENRVSTVFFGEGSTEEGVFSESLNFASLKRLPVLFVCENNLFSVYSPMSVRQPKERDNVSIARAYGIAGKRGDGNDVLDVYRLTEEAVTHIRQGSGPYYLEFDTYRWREHCGPNYDNNLGYRGESEFLQWQQRCPIRSMREKLLLDKTITRGRVEEIEREIEAEIEEAVDFAKKSPFADEELTVEDVIA